MSKGVVFGVRVTPRADRDAIEGPDADGVLRVRVTAPPADGAANKAVVRLVAKALDVPKSSVSLVAGVADRNKRLRVTAVDSVGVQACWPGVASGGRPRP